MITSETERLRLRPLRREDLELILWLYSDQSMEWMHGDYAPVWMSLMRV